VYRHFHVQIKQLKMQILSLSVIFTSSLSL